MLFNSPIFIIYFLPVFLSVYLAVYRKLKNLWALIGSFVFYFWGAPVFALLVIASGIADFFLSIEISKSKRSKQWLILGVAYNLLTLFIFKYFNFFTENAQVLAQSIGLAFPCYMEIALPIGISFFTFQKISYLVDVYRRDSLRARSLVDYLLFVLLFPQLIAGPIVRYKEISFQISDRFATDNWTNRLSGFYRFILGLAKKVLIADALAPLVDLSFGDPSIGALQAWFGLLAYAFQIYFDFSGYSDMAIGLGKMMGFTFPENFNWPYIAKGFQEFWRRWHMTLSAFMRDYLYIPLGGSQGTTSRTIINLWLVFLLSGLWHGASWNFVIWGIWHGLFLTVDRFTGIFKKLPKAFSVGLTFLLVILGWVWFRSETLSESITYFSSLSDFQNFDLMEIKPRQVYLLSLAGVFAFLPFRVHNQILSLTVSRNDIWDVFKAVAAVSLLILCLGQMALSLGQPFIYFRF